MSDFAEFGSCGRVRAHREWEHGLQRWQSGPLQELVGKAHQVYVRRDEEKVKVQARIMAQFLINVPFVKKKKKRTLEIHC